MFGFKKPKFKSRRDVYLRVCSYTAFGPFIFVMGLVGAARFRDLGLLTEDQATHSSYVSAFCGVLGLIYCWYKAFQAFSAIMTGEFDRLPDIPETVVCLKCHEPSAGDNLSEMKCPRCGGKVEDLEGFFDRHPELRNDANDKAS